MFSYAFSSPLPAAMDTADDTCTTIRGPDGTGPATMAVVTKTPTPYRVARVDMSRDVFQNITQEQQVLVMRGILDRCVVAAEQRACAHRLGANSNGDHGSVVPAALMKIYVWFAYNMHACTSVFGPLSTDYPALVRSLQVLEMAFNDFDDWAALGAFAALATRLQDLILYGCGITSLRGLKGRCEYLRGVYLIGCSRLHCLDGLRDRLYLEEVNASRTDIASIEPLRTSPNLRKVVVSECPQMFMIEALEGHQRLQEVDLSRTGIVCIEPLRTCPALTKVNISYGWLTSIDALAGHRWLQEVDASSTPITSIEALRTCPALTTVVLEMCLQLSSIEALEGHECVEMIKVSYSNITTLEPLLNCPTLSTVYATGCEQLRIDNDDLFDFTVIR